MNDDLSMMEASTPENGFSEKLITQKNATPNERDINRDVVPHCAAKWRELGTALGLTSSQLDIINVDHPISCEERCRAMLRKWLDLYHSATWGQLVDAMGTVHSLTDIVSTTTEGYIFMNMAEPVLTCVQCQEEYLESQNAEDQCKYHLSVPGYLNRPGRIFLCCDQKAKDTDSLKLVPGCKKSKHCSEHHENYVYSTYTTFIENEMKKAQQVWLEIDVMDYINKECKWAEVGLFEDNKVYIACGPDAHIYNGIRFLSLEQLKEYTKEGSRSGILEKTSDTGWYITASIVVTDGPVRVEVSIKPASSSQVTTKRATLNLTGTVPALDRIEDLSICSKKKMTDYTLPEDITDGPVIDCQDYSEETRNDYKVEADDGCSLLIKQYGDTDANSTQPRQNGKWSNLFTALLMITNCGDSNLAIVDIEGYFCKTKDGSGDWVKCDGVKIGVKAGDQYHFDDTPNFSLESARTITKVMQLSIKISGTQPSPGEASWRAHRSLPQPLHLKAVFTDHKGRKASIRFEFGNPPITVDTGGLSWHGNDTLLAYCFADDVDALARKQAALYYGGRDGYLWFLSAIQCSYAIRGYGIDSAAKKCVHKAKEAGKQECELEDFSQTSDGTELKAYVLVDLDNEIAYGFKMMIKTPTSLAITHCLLPQSPDPTTMSMTVSPESVQAGHEIVIKWQVSIAFERDHIDVYKEYGRKEVNRMRSYNKKAEMTGEVIVKVPDIPGVYEARYCSATMDSDTTGYYHDIYWMKAKFTVTGLQ
ncbi:uncharacterized protein [Dysidea avara]|uniref:uncharacterized protein isoform X2 n=1 Tax=Dysidea avara TaxID=196820 RepID=UPI003334967B